MEQLDIIFKLCGTPCSSTWPDITDLPWWSMMRPRSVIKRNLKGQFNHLLSIYALELVDKLLKLDPKQRPKSSAVLKHSYFTETPVACSNDEYFQLISRLPKIDGDWHEYDSKMRKKMTQSQNRQIAPPIDERQSSTLSSNTPLTRRESTSALTIPHRTSTSDLSVNALSVKSQPIVSLVTKNPLLSYSSTRFLPPPPPLIRTEERKPRDEVMRDRPTRSYRSSSSSSSDVSPVKKRRLDSEPDLQRNDQFNRDSDKRRSDDIRKRDDSSLKSERQKSKSPIRKTRDPSPKRASINIKSKSPTRVNDHQQNYPRNQDSRSYNVRKNDSISYSSSRDGTWKHDKFPPRKSDYGNSDRHYSSSDNRKQYDRQSYDRPYDDYDRRYYDDHRRQPQIERIVERKFEKPKIDTYRPGNEVKVAPRRDAPLKNSTEIANNHAIRRASISKDTVVTERISKSRNTLDERGNDRSDSRDFKSSNRNEARDRQEPKRVESSSVMIELFFKPKTEEWDHVQPEPDNNHEERVSPKAGDSITAEEVSLMSSVVPMDIMYTLKTPSKQSSPIHDEESPFKNQGDIERRATPLARKASEIEEGEEIEEEIDETMQVELSGDVIPLGIRESEGNEGSNEGNEGNTIKSSVLWNWKG